MILTYYVKDRFDAMTHHRVSHGCRELGGMTRSSEVVMRLNGCDATDGMFDLVFSRPQGQMLTPTLL